MTTTTASVFTDNRVTSDSAPTDNTTHAERVRAASANPASTEVVSPLYQPVFFFFPLQSHSDKSKKKREGKKTPPQNVQVFKCFLAWPLMTSLSPGWMFAVFSSVTHFSTGPARTRLRRREIMESVLSEKKKNNPNRATDTRNLAVV